MTYADETEGSPDPDKRRRSVARVECTPRILHGSVIIGQFGRDVPFRVLGGCERNARGQFETGAPDKYMDAGESIVLNYGFTSNEAATLNDAVPE